LPKAIKLYVRYIDRFNRVVGRATMYMIFGMIGILLWSSISKTFFVPSIWTLEIAQFAMVAFYMLGGPYSVQLGANVRMDLFYGDWPIRKKAWVDAVTVLFLLFYLGVMIYGAVGSTAYSLGHFGDAPFSFFHDLVVGFLTGGPDGAKEVLGYVERSPTAWRPFLWPIKVIMCIGLALMLLQGTSEFFKDIARIRGEEL